MNIFQPVLRLGFFLGTKTEVLSLTRSESGSMNSCKFTTNWIYYVLVAKLFKNYTNLWKANLIFPILLGWNPKFCSTSFWGSTVWSPLKTQFTQLSGPWTDLTRYRAEASNSKSCPELDINVFIIHLYIGYWISQNIKTAATFLPSLIKDKSTKKPQKNTTPHCFNLILARWDLLYYWILVVLLH